MDWFLYVCGLLFFFGSFFIWVAVKHRCPKCGAINTLKYKYVRYGDLSESVFVIFRKCSVCKMSQCGPFSGVSSSIFGPKEGWSDCLDGEEQPLFKEEE